MVDEEIETALSIALLMALPLFYHSAPAQARAMAADWRGHR